MDDHFVDALLAKRDLTPLQLRVRVGQDHRPIRIPIGTWHRTASIIGSTASATDHASEKGADRSVTPSHRIGILAARIPSPGARGSTLARLNAVGRARV